MYNTRVRFACPIYFSRDQSSSKLIIFLDSKLERSNSRVAKIDSRLDSRNFRGSRIESRVEFRNSRVTVNLPLSGTVCKEYGVEYSDKWYEYSPKSIEENEDVKQTVKSTTGGQTL